MASSKTVNDLLNGEKIKLKACGTCKDFRFGVCHSMLSPRYGLPSFGVESCNVYREDKILASIKSEQTTKETVNHPNHYNMGKIEAITFIEDWELNFSLGNAIKYIVRAPYKGNQVEDLEKAIWYLNRELERVKQHNITKE